MMIVRLLIRLLVANGGIEGARPAAGRATDALFASMSTASTTPTGVTALPHMTSAEPEIAHETRETHQSLRSSPFAGLACFVGLPLPISSLSCLLANGGTEARGHRVAGALLGPHF